MKYQKFVLLLIFVFTISSCSDEKDTEETVCGNNICEVGENSTNCSQDCRDSTITCENYEYFLDVCDECEMNNCATSYSSLSLDIQLNLDDCSDYISDAADNSICSDFGGDIASCVNLAEQYLGLNCP
ncbi:hypothetical protein KKF97_17765 [Myxococcota bacterium]|nr:hypothetical protein [Myxococcota bacterium]MBU1381007.1 hypothetical protein [Myxococcota bacterium]MBU1502649.1 hypothetical protein [bacterium]